MLSYLEDKGGDEELASRLNEIYQQQSKTRYLLERDWLLNIAFFLGHQYLFYNNRATRLEYPKVPSWRVRLVFNYIKPIVLSQVARLLKARPTMNVLPGSKEDSDAAAAKVAEKVLDYIWRKLKIPMKLRQLAMWFSTATTTFLKVEFDPSAGDIMEIDVPDTDKAGNPKYAFQTDEAGQPVVGEDGQPVVAPAMKKQSVPLGEISVEIITPFEIYVPDSATDLDSPSCPWVMICKFYERSEFLRRWPEAEGKVNFATKEPARQSFYEATILSAFSNYNTGSDQQKGQLEGIACQEWIFKPDANHRHSTRVVIADKNIISKYEDPELKGGFPVFAFGDIVIPGRFWHDAVVQDLRPLNKEYNRTKSQIVEIKNLMAKPKWTVPRGAGIKDTAITDEPGEVIMFNGTIRPEPTRPPEIPQYVFDHAQKILDDMQNISNVRSVAVRPPGRITSGVAIAAMNEQDDSAFGPTAVDFENSLESVARRILYLISQHYKEERLVQIMGRNGEADVFDFKGSDIGENFDVIVQTGSSLPRSKVAKQELIMRLAEGGWFGPVEDPNVRMRVLKILELGSSEDLVSEFYPSAIPFGVPGAPPGMPSVPPGAQPPQNPIPPPGTIFPGNPDADIMRNEQAIARY